MRYELHPEAALEHEKQVAYFERRAPGLGQRYHEAFRSAALRASEGPRRYRVISSIGIRRVPFRGFLFAVIYRELGEIVQVLAVAPHRKHPGYWAGRL